MLNSCVEPMQPVYFIASSVIDSNERKEAVIVPCTLPAGEWIDGFVDGWAAKCYWWQQWWEHHMHSIANGSSGSGGSTTSIDLHLREFTSGQVAITRFFCALRLTGSIELSIFP